METSPIKISRLNRKEFKEVLRKGMAFKESFLVVKIVKERDSKEIKIGILISRKILKKAVQRNKLKRRIKEIIRSRKNEIKQGAKMVFIPLSGIKIDFRSLEKKVVKILQKSKTIS